MMQRGGLVVIPMLENVQPPTLDPLIQHPVVPGALVSTDADTIDGRLCAWGDEHTRVNHGVGAYASDEEGDGFCAVHVNTREGFWSWWRSWLRPPRGIAQEKLPLSLGLVECVHPISKRGNALLHSLMELLVK
jgi:transposase